jgi:hypothetical protein
MPKQNVRFAKQTIEMAGRKWQTFMVQKGSPGGD